MESQATHAYMHGIEKVERLALNSLMHELYAYAAAWSRCSRRRMQLKFPAIRGAVQAHAVG